MTDTLETRIAKLEKQNAALARILQQSVGLQFDMLKLLIERGIIPDDSTQSQLEGLHEHLSDALDELTRGDSSA